MKIKTLFTLVIGLVIIVVIAAGAFITLFDPNDYKQQIIEQVQEETGRNVSIDGQLGWDLYPRIAISAEGVTLGNPEGFSSPNMLQVKHAAFSAALIPLLRQEIIVESVSLDGANIALERLANGKDNWSDLQKGGEDKPHEGGGDRGDSEVMVKRIEITNTSFSFNDAQANEKHSLQINKITTGMLGARRAVPVELDLVMDSSRLGQYELEGKGTLTVDEKFSYINAPDLELTLTPVKHPEQQVTVSGNIGLDQERKQFVMRDFEITSADGRVSGELQAADYSSKPQVEGNLDIDSLSIASLAKAFGADASGLPEKVSGKMVIKTAGDTVNINPLSLKAAGGSIEGNLAVKTPVDKATYSGSFKIAQLNPGKLMGELGMEAPQVSSDKALSSLAGNFSFNGDTDHVQLKPFNIKLDSSSINGDVRITRFDNPHFAFNLAVDKINVDHYLPPTDADDKKESAAVKEAKAAKTIGGLRLDGSVKIGSLHASGLSMSNFKANIISAGGETRLSPLSAGLYGGSYNGNIVLRGKGKRLTWSANERLKGVNIGPLLKDLVGQERIDGKADVTLKINGSGVDKKQMMSSLGGNTTFTVRNGSVKGINLAAALREAKAKLNNRPVEKAKEARQTDFAELSGTAKIKSGVVTNNDLVMKSPFLRVTGKGTVNLPASSVNYLLTTKVTSTIKGQGGAEFSDLEGLTIPIRVKGHFDNLSYSLDLEELLKERAKQELDKEKDKLKGKLLEKLGLPVAEEAPVAAPADAAATDQAPAAEETKKKKSVEDKLKDSLLKGLKF
ncbi:AsmA family protein [Solemya velum gill symbiont]|uniref:AsmA family protein n=1 Tax=Solemya velum gill symbiont TaxID=2340 RepID=UPI000997BBC1|nr:AsmA family protein [Solemya velum gill symbiont]OOZ44802.1 hypothetical protein BOW37_05845 [Solemya velum gill symbiont]OOZ45796.1 hypothetical protein BOW38_08955 [Solemya velum gill symbiont]OOZ50630.1 hypothetical protein BOW39_02425 [Solemya velum gill symbiont]OOZ51875.1 hypothetical protein BOW40_05900 [Solemya velum gill symbiont]OOZ54418.1 hypothetical protein BOW41_06610 [Solemya velum gill symbiont]